MTAFSYTRFVPGDVMMQHADVLNSANAAGGISVNYFLTVKDTTNSGTGASLDHTLSDNTYGLRLVAVRCYSDAGGTTLVACSSASTASVRLVSGVMGSQSSTFGGSGVLALGAAGALSSKTIALVSNSSGSAVLTIDGTGANNQVTGVALVTSGNSNCSSNGTDGSCPMGGPSTGVTSPAVAGLSAGTASFNTPAVSSGNSLAQAAHDYVSFLVYLPTTAKQGTTGTGEISQLNTAVSYNIILTGVQPDGVIASSSAVHS